MEDIKKAWYKEMVVYQIWPRSFCDGNGDGIGDLKGVLSKLDYLKDLGITAIWFSPLYVSPGKDRGYDIADYKDIAPEYGTLDDFKEVVREAHKRGIRIIMDLVINHTSDQNKWFIESKKSKDNPYHDYYFWRKGKLGNRLPPNNWTSNFSGPAWEYDKNLGEYYLHLFTKEQPDLNMDNPKVREEIKDILKFWLDIGVDGFREDVITYISKVEGLPNGLPSPAAGGIDKYQDGPNLHKYLQEFKSVWSKYDCMTVGEAPMMTPKKALKHIAEGPEQDLNMMFHFQHMGCDCIINAAIPTKFNLKKFKKVFTNWQTGLYGKAWNANYIENHDQPRSVNRFGNLKYREASAKMLATMYICLCGTPFIYQGQEIGMTNICLPDISLYDDVSSKDLYKTMRKLGLPEKVAMKNIMYGSRDNARTPVQWSADKNAGFTSADKAWFYVNPNYKDINVEDAESDPDSILNYYKKLLKFRRENEICIYGSYKEHYHESNDLYVYSRHYKNQRMLVICSFSDKDFNFKAPEGFDLNKGTIALSNYGNPKNYNDGCFLKPYETRVYLFEE